MRILPDCRFSPSQSLDEQYRILGIDKFVHWLIHTSCVDLYTESLSQLQILPHRMVEPYDLTEVGYVWTRDVCARSGVIISGPLVARESYGPPVCQMTRSASLACSHSSLHIAIVSVWVAKNRDSATCSPSTFIQTLQEISSGDGLKYLSAE